MRAPLVEVRKEFRFEAAHWLPAVPPGHKDGRVHGHSYRVVVRVQGPVAPESGYVCDFGDISAAVRPVIDELDHRCLNDVPGLENPTSEVLACWLWARLDDRIAGLAAIEVMESETTGCAYRGGATDVATVVGGDQRERR